MTATGTSRVRSNFPTSVVQCTVLSEGYQHLIEARPTNRDIIAKLVAVHGSGSRYAPVVTFKNGQTRRLILGQLSELTDASISFTATMANGNELVRVTGSFTGDTGGHVTIEGTLG